MRVYSGLKRLNGKWRESLGDIDDWLVSINNSNDDGWARPPGLQGQKPSRGKTPPRGTGRAAVDD